jgi:hypothetical protein
MTATLKAGQLVYLYTIHSGLFACRVLRVYKSERDDLADHAQVDVVVTATRKSARPKGTRRTASVCLVIPRDAVRSKRIRAYAVELTPPMLGDVRSTVTNS